MESLPGQYGSLWLATAPPSARRPLDRDVHADVAVVGGGIAGLTTAVELSRGGADVVLIEADRIGAGVTGYSTAKLSSLHGLIYTRLVKKHGDDAAQAYGEANEAGISRVAELVGLHSLDCDLRFKSNFTYTEDLAERDKIEEEVVNAAGLGLPASYTEQTDLPFPIAAAVRFENQAEFHPVKYLRGLADACEGPGLRIFERTRAVSLDDGKPVRIETDAGRTVTADRVVVATHIPYADRGLFFARTHPERSYGLAARVRGELPQGMYLSTESPAHSLKAYGDVLIVAGEGHKPGQGDAAERYRRLAAYARERFPVESFEYRWATHDNMPIDSLPFIGPLSPLSGRVHVATGFQKWGLAMGTTAGRILADTLAGRDNPWRSVFDTRRLNLRASFFDFVKENANSGIRFMGDRLTKRATREDVAPGEGRVVGRGSAQLAVSRDTDGTLHVVSARCTHLGCIVNWNSGDAVWDCPCHGSRFKPDGTVIQGPAVRPLPPRDLG